MARSELPSSRGRRVGRSVLARLAEDYRLARVAAGLSSREVARSAGISRSRLSRLERDGFEQVSVADLAVLLAVVGLDLRAGTVPGATAHRDAAHAALLRRVPAVVHPSWRWRVEVPLPNPGDPRSWDAALSLGSLRVGVEAETAPRDGQELQRRLALKRRDGGMDHVLLALADTRGNRRFLEAYGPSLRVDFPGRQGTIVGALREGRDPGMSGIVVL